MQRVDRLLVKAKKAVQRNAERFFMGFVEQDPDTGKWTAQGQLFGGKINGVRQIFQSMTPWKPPLMRFRFWWTHTPTRYLQP